MVVLNRTMRGPIWLVALAAIPAMLLATDLLGSPFVERFRPTQWSRWKFPTYGCPGAVCNPLNVDTGNGLIISVPAVTTSTLADAGAGGEMCSFSKYSYGKYEAAMRVSPPPALKGEGVVNALFMYLADDNEIDVEILSREHDSDPATKQHHVFVWFVLHNATEKKEVAIRYKLVEPLDNPDGKRIAPWTTAHTYGFIWERNRLTGLIDGKAICLGGDFADSANIPQLPGYLMLNNWSNGGAWSGKPPSTETKMYVDRVAYSRSTRMHYDPCRIR
jgi:Glycosyl hydrolases family 16